MSIMPNLLHKLENDIDDIGLVGISVNCSDEIVKGVKNNFTILSQTI